MDIEKFREYCLTLPGAEEKAPWTEPQYSMLVTYSVGGKWFCIENLDEKFINVKGDPERVAEMQSRYTGAFPAWHMNKEHWLGIRLESDVPDSVIRDLVRQGYDLIVGKLPKKTREELNLV